MKKEIFLPFAVLSAVMSGVSAQAQQTIYTGQNAASGYYADFTTYKLNVSYTYNAGTGIGTFTASGTSAALGDTYTSNPLAAGTDGLKFWNNHFTGGTPDAFTGTYTLTAYVQKHWRSVAGG